MEQQDLQSNYRRDLKERILTVAMQAFKLRGIRNVRMDDIATTLGISVLSLKVCKYSFYSLSFHSFFIFSSFHFLN